MEKKKYEKTTKYKPHIKCFIRQYVIQKQILVINKLTKLLKRKFDVIAKKTSIYEIIKKFHITRKRITKRFIYGKKYFHKRKIKQFQKQIKNINVNDINNFS